MSTSLTGRLVDGAGDPLSGLRVAVTNASDAFGTELGYADSASDGSFTVSYIDDTTSGDVGQRMLNINVYSQVHRKITFQATGMSNPDVVYQAEDPTTDTFALGDVHIVKAETSGWAVTLGGSDKVRPVRDGNTVLPLVDDQDAWNHVKDSMAGATNSIDVLQLEFDVPKEYDPDESNEKPEVVISFGDPFDPAQGRQVGSAHNDFRPERVLLSQATDGTVVRVMLNVVSPSVLASILLLGIPVFIAWLFNRVKGQFPDLKKYFDAANQPPESTAPQLQSFGVGIYYRVHAKLVMVDDTEVIVTASPFCQSYWDSHDHHVYDAHRGSATGESIPVHDVSMAVRGPAVSDMHDAFIRHWNLNLPQASQISPITPAAPISTGGPGESIASLQLVRTLNGGVFPDLPDGEMGCLELYLRAIENAKTYIYFENQYFTNDTIAKAIVAALNDPTRPDLQVIFLLNVVPDLPCYPTWQANLIGQIRTDAKANASRVGFFTAWTHDPPAPSQQHTNPMIMANYVHAKLGIADGAWATVGSANLDGASLDANQLLHAIQFGDNRNHELNYAIFNGVDGYPATDAVDKLRIALWSEHLGIDATDPRLASSPANDKGWLALWKSQAAAKLAGLTSNPATINPGNGRVLEYPAKVATSERDFLKNSQISLTNLDYVERVRAFNFATGSWV
jgi:phosphatidylserine/phosphatidylglycerophosphate/cardiolipin synthase-like enzyme